MFAIYLLINLIACSIFDNLKFAISEAATGGVLEPIFVNLFVDPEVF